MSDLGQSRAPAIISDANSHLNSKHKASRVYNGGGTTTFDLVGDLGEHYSSSAHPLDEDSAPMVSQFIDSHSSRNNLLNLRSSQKNSIS
jgi:hypothetical protein